MTLPLKTKQTLALGSFRLQKNLKKFTTNILLSKKTTSEPEFSPQDSVIQTLFFVEENGEKNFILCVPATKLWPKLKPSVLK